jgi:FHS family Na+ dependent glucose MFS transporter 1
LIKKHTFQNTIGYYALFICLGLDVAILGPTLPALAEQTRARVGQMGMLFLAGSIGYTLGTTLGGRIFDRVRGHPILGIAQLVAAALIALVPITPWLWLLMLIATCKGIAEGIINTGGNTLLVWTHRDKVGPYMNGLHFFFGVGAFISPLLVAQVAGVAGGYRWAYWILAGIAALVGLFTLTLPASPQPEHHPEDSATNTPTIPIDYKFIIVAGLFLFFYVGAEITYGGWIYTYAFTLGLANAIGAAYLTSAFWLSFTLGRLISVPLALRFSPRQMIRVALVGCLIFLTLALALHGSPPALWIVTIGLGFSMAPIYPSGFTLAGQSIQLTGRASGIILLGDSLGGMVLPWLVGQVIDASGPGAMIYLIFFSLLGNLLAFLGMLRLRPKVR